MEKKKVLIVDDSELIRDMLQKFLERCGCMVCGTARSGKEGIELFKSLKPDMVFMDINMPVMTGREAVKSILSEDPNAKIIVISSVGDNDTMAELKGLGVTAFIKKPVNIHNIITVLSQI